MRQSSPAWCAAATANRARLAASHEFDTPAGTCRKHGRARRTAKRWPDNLFTGRILSRPHAFSERLVHDRNTRRSFIVLGVKIAARQKRNAERAEIMRRNEICIH